MTLINLMVVCWLYRSLGKRRNIVSQQYFPNTAKRRNSEKHSQAVSMSVISDEYTAKPWAVGNNVSRTGKGRQRNNVPKQKSRPGSKKCF